MKKFFTTTVLGGVTVVAPIVILAFVFTWLYDAVAGFIKPLPDWAMSNIVNHAFVANIAVLGFILFLCFFIGFLVKTKLGKELHTLFEKLLKYAPFYRIIKETVSQFIGNKKSPFSSVAMVDLFGNGTLVTAFVTDETEIPFTKDKKLITIFIPTAPNPTSGLILSCS